MATTAAEAGKKAPSRKPKKALTPFGGAVPIAIVGLIGTFVGFFPTFFSRLSEVGVIQQVHGWTMTVWLVVVLTQALLIRSHQYKLHRMLGWASVALFCMMFGSSLQVVSVMLSQGSAVGLPYEADKFFAYSDIINLPLIPFLFGGAIYWRKDRYLHSRLVAATVLTSIVPALARFFNILIWRSIDGLFYAMHPTYLLILGMLGAAIYADWKNSKLRWPLPLVFGWFVFDYITIWPGYKSQWFEVVAQFFASFY